MRTINPIAKSRFSPLRAAALLLVLHAAAQADPTGASITLGPPSDDVWVYTFGQGAFATVAPTYAGDFSDPFPDRFGTFFLTFDADGLVPDATRPVRVVSFSLEMSMLNSSSFDQNNGVIYDPSYDPVATYLDPQFDQDPGRPMELYAVGYRNGFDLDSWRAANFPVTGNDGYNAIPVDFPPGQSSGRSISNSVNDAIDTHPLAIGTTPDLIGPAGGTQRVLDLARWTFATDQLTDEESAYLSSEIASGSLSFMLSSMQLAGFEGMGGDEIYPRWATLETAFPVEDASLTLVIEVSPPADVNADFRVDIEDLYAWERSDGLLDVNGDGSVTPADRSLLIESLRAEELADTFP